METGTPSGRAGSGLHVHLNIDGNAGSRAGDEASHRAGGRGRRRPRKRQRCCCWDKNVKRGVGAVIFTLGIPVAITGVILTVVAYSALVAEAPGSFPVLGPLLMALSALLFFAGAALTELIPPAWLQDCCCLPDSFQSACWRRCPDLCQLLYPDDVCALDKGAALHALTTEPSRSALKKPRGPPPDFDLPHGETMTLQERDVDATTSEPRRSRGVKFSDSGGDDGDNSTVGGGSGNGGGDRTSTSTDQSDNNSADATTPLTSSAVSLRHCRIHPASEASWASLKADPPVFTISETPENPAPPSDPPGSEANPASDTTTLMESA